jgi:hypothetical protein
MGAGLRGRPKCNITRITVTSYSVKLTWLPFLFGQSFFRLLWPLFAKSTVEKGRRADKLYICPTLPRFLVIKFPGGVTSLLFSSHGRTIVTKMLAK